MCMIIVDLVDNQILIARNTIAKKNMLPIEQSKHKIPDCRATGKGDAFSENTRYKRAHMVFDSHHNNKQEQYARPH